MITDNLSSSFWLTSPSNFTLFKFLLFFNGQIIIHCAYVCVEVKGAQSCPTLCDPMDYRVHGILQARILEWVAVPFSRGSFQPRDRTQVSHIAGGRPKNIGSPRILEWVACPFSSESLWPRNRTGVSCIAVRKHHILFLRILHIVFHSGCTNFHSYQVSYGFLLFIS